MSRYIKQFSHKIRSLQTSDKIIFIGSLFLITGLFLPWFTINSSDLFSDGSSISYIAFTGITYIIGYLCYIFTISALSTIDKKLTVLIAGITFLLFLLNIFFNKSKDGITLFATMLFLLINLSVIFVLDNSKLLKRLKKHLVNTFTGTQNFILIFVALMIYQRLSGNYTSANLNFGIYISLLGASLILYGGFLQTKAFQKKSIKEVFTPANKSLHNGIDLKPDLNIDKPEENKNNNQAKKKNSQLSFGDYE